MTAVRDTGVTAERDRAWVGVDVRNTHHWVCAVDTDGKALFSTKVSNDEADILAVIATAGSLA